MEKIKCSPYQFFSLMILFQFGTALVVNLGLTAGRDAWMAILLGTVFGLFIFWGFSYLYRLFPEMLPTDYNKILLGKVAGTIVSMLYMVFFIYVASRDLRDGGTLILSSTLRQTPLSVVNALMILSVAYVLHKGIEVLARTALLFMVLELIIGLFTLSLLVFSDIIHWERLLPMLEDGFGPVWKAVIQQDYAFPFGEVVCFASILPFLSHGKLGIKAGYLSILIAGLVLSFISSINIAVLGVDMASRAPLPLMTTISKASITEFIQRNDILVVMTLIIGDFFKVAIYFFAALIGTSSLSGIPYRKLIYPVALIIWGLSLVVAQSMPEHLEEGSKVLYTASPVFFVVFPLLLFVAGWIYSKRNRGKPQEEESAGD
ncbi:spore germination protein KB [Paenibacillus shirakamiensis]|uniref:Spore germination protein KB n=1 Tax=Paenibacillus shirakamiensis TaxID=1265935 RepID=A0ABS4JLN6_9BACL|nr:GerAB/ArcD/ProY family transporter [Paenibacillus shirakamiensis]MBP2001881.1 spore germination protein KB [Paenibacillus shirakamiensis]